MDRLAVHDRSSATFRRSSWSKWNVLLEVLGSTGAPSAPSNVTAEKPKVLTSVMESPKTLVWEEEQRVTNTLQRRRTALGGDSSDLDPVQTDDVSDLKDVGMVLQLLTEDGAADLLVGLIGDLQAGAVVCGERTSSGQVS